MVYTISVLKIKHTQKVTIWKIKKRIYAPFAGSVLLRKVIIAWFATMKAAKALVKIWMTNK